MVQKTKQTLSSLEATFAWLDSEAAKQQTQAEQYSEHLNNSEYLSGPTEEQKAAAWEWYYNNIAYADRFQNLGL